MLRRRIIAAATATVLALGMSVGGAGAALATTPTSGYGTATVYEDSGPWTGSVTCKKAFESENATDISDNLNGASNNVNPAGTWGSLSWSGTTLSWVIAEGWTVDLCIKGSTKAVILEGATGTSSYDFASINNSISHVGFANATYTPPQPTSVEGSVTPTAENCFDENGEILFVGDEGVVFTFQGVQYEPGDRATGLAAGDYTVTVGVVSDDYTLTSAASLPVTVGSTEIDCPVEPTSVEGSVTPTAENCFDENGEILFVGDEGVVFTFQGVQYEPGDRATGLAAGDYTVTVGVVSDDYTLTSAASLPVTVGSTEIECEEATLVGSIATTACETDVPYILFSIELNDPDNQSTAGLEDAEIIFSGLDSEGNEREYVLDNLEGTVEDGVFSGRVLWPGAAIVDGQAAGWPGWELVDGEWQNVGDDNFGWTRGLDSVTLSVNPTLEVELSYPAATPDCATEPTAVEPTVEYSYSCLFGGTIELSDTPGVIWTVNGEQTDQRTWVGQDIEFAPVITASLDPEMPGLYFGPEAVTETTVEFELPEEGCDLVTSPLVTPLLSSKQATCTTAGSYTLNAIEGVQWLVNGQVTTPGTYTATTGSSVEVEAVALQGFGFGFETQTEWTLSFPAPADGCLTTTDLPTLALTGASGMLGTVGIIALLITLTGIGAVVARRRVEA